MYFTWLALFGLFVAVIRLNQKYKELENQVFRLYKDRTPPKETPEATTAPKPPITPEAPPLTSQAPAWTAPPLTPETPSWTPPPAPPMHATEPADPRPAPMAPQIPPTTPAGPSLWDGWKDQIAENWTGVVGSALFVLGVVFFGILGSLYLGPAGRFAVLLGVAGGLYGIKLWISAKKGWEQFGAWLQAASGAILLVACVGAGGIDGLKFIENPAAGLAVLLAGIAMNLGFAHAVARQSIASLHVILCLVALMIAPATTVILVCGAVVTGAGIALSYRKRWEANLFCALLSFTIFHFLWLEQNGTQIELIRIPAILSVLGVAIIAAFVHYRREYESPTFDAGPASVHLFNWLALGYGLLRYSQGSQVTVVLLFIAAIAATALSRVAKHRRIAWLHLLDALAGQVLFLIAIGSLGRFGMQRIDMTMLMLAEVLIFATICVHEKERTLARLGYLAAWGCCMAFIGLFFEPLLTNRLAPNYTVGYRALGLGVGLFLFHLMTSLRGFLGDSLHLFVEGDSQLTKFSPLQFVTPFLWLGALMALRDQTYALPGFAALFVVSYCCQSKIEDFGHYWGIRLATFIFAVFAWHRLTPVSDILSEDNLPIITTPQWVIIFTLIAMPLLMLPKLFAFSKIRQRVVSTFPVLLLTVHAALVCYRITQPISDFGPGMGYLLLAILVMELARGLQQWCAKDRPELGDLALQSAFFFFGLFLYRHFVVHIQSEVGSNFISMRAAIELGALGTMLYWICYPVRLSQQTASKVTSGLNSLLLEGFLAFLISIIVLECEAVWHSLAWVLLAFAIAGGVKRKIAFLTQRTLVYAWLLFLASTIQLCAVSSTMMVIGDSWKTNPFVFGGITIIAQFAFVAYVYLDKVYADDAGFITQPTAFRGWLNALKDSTTKLFFYPLAVSLAIYLYWRFDHAILTLLWVVEVFALFVMGFVVREKHFVRFALTMLVICVSRLIIYDLAQTQILVRALVFVLVGVIMLVMNATVRRFKERFPK